jgi:hypothetical protein
MCQKEISQLTISLNNTAMSTTLYNIALVTHIIGITIMAGTTFIDFITFRAFCKVFKTDKIKGSELMNNYLYKLQRFLGIGMVVILISGVIMMVKLHEVWGAQLWFRIKMGVLLLIIINGLGLRRMIGAKLKKVLAEDLPGSSINEKWNGIKRNFTIIQVIQMLLFIIIYVLSAFKFN